MTSQIFYMSKKIKIIQSRLQFKYSQILSYMNSPFFFTFDCTDPEKQKLIKKNQVCFINDKKTKIFNAQKLAFSLKEKKYVHKHQNPYKSHKKVDQNFKTHKNQRETHQDSLQTLSRFCISKQVQQIINLNTNKPQKVISSIKSSLIRFSIPDSQQGLFQKDNLRSTQETQLQGAQSTIYGSQRNPERIICKKEEKSSSINQNNNPQANGLWKSANLSKVIKLVKGRSESNLLKIEQKQKRQFLSMLENDQKPFEVDEKQQKISTDHLQQSKSYGKKKKLDEMDIRSICSIKEQSSGDDFSEVIVQSRLNLGKRHFSLEERLFQDFS